MCRTEALRSSSSASLSVVAALPCDGKASKLEHTLCVELLLAIARRPRLAALYAEVEHARGDSFRPDWRISDLIEQSRPPTAPDPGIVQPDDGHDMDLLELQIRTALQQPPRKGVDLAARPASGPVCGCCAAASVAPDLPSQSFRRGILSAPAHPAHGEVGRTMPVERLCPRPPNAPAPST
ncbi:hypothetical protein [Streptomyces phaeoluteigriseus]